MAIANFTEQQRRPLNRVPDTRKCYACNKIGHIATTCPTRRHDTNALGEDLREAPLIELFDNETEEEEYCPAPPAVDNSHLGRTFRSLSAATMDSNSTAIHAYLTIEGHQFKTLIDTGASISLLSEEALQTLGREVQEQDAVPAMTVDRSLTDMRGLVRQVQVKVADLTFPSTFRIMGKTSYPVILGWDFLKQAKGVIIASRMVLQVSQNGQDVEIPIFDITTSKPEDAQVQRKPYYAEDAEFEMVNATQAIEYIDLGERSWGQVFHKTYQAIAGT